MSISGNGGAERTATKSLQLGIWVSNGVTNRVNSLNLFAGDLNETI